MARKVMALAAKPDNMSSISRTHVAEGENQLPQDIFWFSYVHPYKGSSPGQGIDKEGDTESEVNISR